ncbi:MAG: hypothetical protein DMF63_06120 [Acidobacteria bacterium]|nr:MAG: hypothetical protein DMF63_06120 [Acidobacteriota bacterium]
MPIYINKNGQQSGPYEDHIVIDQLKNGSLSPNDLGIMHGGTRWQRLGDMFRGIGVAEAKPIASESHAASTATPPKKGGCLKFGLIGTGLLFLLLGVSIAIGSRFIPSVSCNLAESDAHKIDKLRSDLDKATKDGKYERIGPLQIELEEELEGATVTQQYCNDDKFRNNVIGGAGGVLGFVGFLMALIGLFVGRRK